MERNWKEGINGEHLLPALGNFPSGRQAKCERGKGGERKEMENNLSQVLRAS